jgi:hypothetical protein
VLIEPDIGLRLRELECPDCHARIFFRRARSPYIDELGFETHALDCRYCRSHLAGVIDPYDSALLLPIGADKVEGRAALTRWRQAWPLAGLGLAAMVNVLWVGMLGYAVFALL